MPEIVPLFTILIEISAENGIFRRLFKLLTPRAQEARFSENTDYPRPTTNSITLGTVVMEMNSEESADDSDA